MHRRQLLKILVGASAAPPLPSSVGVLNFNLVAAFEGISAALVKVSESLICSTAAFIRLRETEAMQRLIEDWGYAEEDFDPAEGFERFGHPPYIPREETSPSPEFVVPEGVPLIWLLGGSWEQPESDPVLPSVHLAELEAWKAFEKELEDEGWLPLRPLE